MNLSLTEVAAGTTGTLIDGCGRVVDRLRVSVTDRCDLRCQYCRTDASRSSDHLLTDPERLDFLTFLVETCGLRQVRFTGGEPLVYSGLRDLVAATRRIAPDLSIATTTNGQRLAELAAPLRAAGLNRINVSLDSLQPARYRQLTGGRLERTLAGLDAAAAAGFSGIRINCVALRDVNDEELPGMLRWAAENGYEIRFLEAMSIGPAGGFNHDHFVSARQVREIIGSELKILDCGRARGSTSHAYRVELDGHVVEFGIIAPVTEPFCTDCRRMRLTADGRLFPCLLDTRDVDFLPLLRAHASPERLRAQLEGATRGKAPGGSLQSTPMVQLGG